MPNADAPSSVMYLLIDATGRSSNLGFEEKTGRRTVSDIRTTGRTKEPSTNVVVEAVTCFY